MFLNITLTPCIIIIPQGLVSNKKHYFYTVKKWPSKDLTQVSKTDGPNAQLFCQIRKYTSLGMHTTANLEIFTLI